MSSLRKRVGNYYVGRTLGEVNVHTKKPLAVQAFTRVERVIELCQGTYAKVKYGQNVRTGEAVAIKVSICPPRSLTTPVCIPARNCSVQVLDKKRLQEAGMEEQIKREIHILKNLHHPHIVDLKEVMASAESVFMVMELVPGGELFDQVLLEGAVEV